MLLFFIPVFMAACCLYLYDYITKNPHFHITKKITVVSFLGVLFGIFGYLVNDIYLRKLVRFVNFTNKSLDFSFSIKKIENMWLYFKMSISVNKWDDYVSIISNICVFMVLFLFVYFIYFIFKSDKHPASRLVVLSFIFALLEQVAVAYLTPYFKSKYVYLAAVYAPIIVCVYLKISSSKLNKNIFAVFIFALLIHGVVVTVHAFDKNARSKYDFFVYQTYYDEYLEDIITYLKDNKYTFGYGNYTEVHTITELTDGKIEGAPISFHKCNIFAMKWDSLVRYYEYGNHEGKVFLMIPERFYNSCKDINPLIKGKDIILRHNQQVLFNFDNKDLLDYLNRRK